VRAACQNLVQRISYIRDHVLGINYRNSEYIFKHNPKHLYPLVDDKLKGKDVLLAVGIPVPETYAAIRSYFDLKALPTRLHRLNSFVIKPTNGFGGEGVLIVEESLPGGRFRLADGSHWTLKDLRRHLQEILAGVYSLNQFPDTALCEYKINGDDRVGALSFKGIPDIRILVFRGIPVMAMLRLSTKRSKGKANLHQGGIGVGIDLSTGRTTHAISDGHYVTHHPDSGIKLSDVIIPHWENLLRIATHSYKAVPLGYLGVDLVIDRDLGPMVLELNARPGLQLQMANRMGLKKTLAQLQKQDNVAQMSQAECISLGKTLYENERQKALKVSNQPLITTCNRV
jgi:alpha-L-glutamate ligase-like protein